MYKLEYSQKLPLSIEQCWNFFSSPGNLKILTPEYLGFDITTQDKNQMYAGQIIAYTIRPLWNLPFEWVTEITQVKEPHYFIDVQLCGPYKIWHHEHRFNSILNGVEMTDTVYYKMPFGPIGKVIHALKVKRDLEGIFRFRKNKLEKMFGPYKGENG